MLARMSSKGQLVIPKHLRTSLGLEAGSMIEIVLEDGRLVLRPVAALSPLDALVGMFADGPDLIAELEAEHRAEMERDDQRRP